MDAQQQHHQRQVVGCVTPVISLQKLKEFFVQPKFRAPPPQGALHPQHASHGPGNSLDESRAGALDSASQLHSLYGNHTAGGRGGGSAGASPPTSSSSSSSMLVVPQPISAAKSPGAQPLNSAQGPTTANGTGRKYQCKMCPQIFGSKADLQLHTQIHMREAKPYKCSQCSKAFANSSYLSQHTRIHLGIKPYRCEICQRKFTQLSHLQQHIRTHTGDKPYKCRHPGCNKAFSQLSNLQSHSRCHQTDKPYKCNSCYKCFSDEASLLEHIPKHKESKHLKTHICQYCGKSYTQETYLAKHMQKHADRIEKRGAQPPIGINGPPHQQGHPPHHQGHPTQQQQQQQQQQQHHQQQQQHHIGRMPGSPDGFWSKSSSDNLMDVRSHMHTGGGHVNDTACLQGLADHRLHLRDLQEQQQQQQQHHHRPALHPRPDHHNDMGMSPTQNPYDTGGMTTGGNGGGSGGGGGTTGTGSGGSGGGAGGGGHTVKTTSAFTPIQTGMLPLTTGGGQLHGPVMPGSSRTYFPYEPIGFPKAQNTMEAKPPHTSFPNQLISLHQIRNYASMPSVTGAEHPISLKDKGQQ